MLIFPANHHPCRRAVGFQDGVRAIFLDVTGPCGAGRYYATKSVAKQAFIEKSIVVQQYFFNESLVRAKLIVQQD